MKKFDKKLASRLLYLPLDLNEKVLLWLTYRGLKPVSNIYVKRRNFSLLRKGNVARGPAVDQKKKREIRKWIKDAGLFCLTKENDWYVGKNSEKVKLLTKTIDRFDSESEYETGTLLGYPRNSVKAYAFNRKAKLGQKQIPMIGSLLSDYSALRNRYFAPYVMFSIRADSIKEDVKVAKLWADTIRKEVPLLAKWYETKENEQKKREKKLNLDIELIARRKKQTVSEILDEYSVEDGEKKQVLLKAVTEFFSNYISEFQLASICWAIKKKLSRQEKTDEEFLEILEAGRGLWKPEKRIRISAKISRIRKLREWSEMNTNEKKSHRVKE